MRALDPWPGAFFEMPAASTSACSPPRPSAANRRQRRAPCSTQALSIACGTGALRPLRLQRPGRGPLDAAAFLRGFPIPPGTLAAVPRYKLTIEYDGAGLVGWQRQPQGLSVQEALETAVANFCGERVSGSRRRPHRCRRPCAGPGRPSRPCAPGGARCLARRGQPSSAPDRDQRARRRARARQFRRPAVGDPAGLRLSHPQPARAGGAGARAGVAGGAAARRRGDARRRAGISLGHHDFTTFRDRLCQARSPLRTLDALEVSRSGDEIRIEARARSFLHRQVRNMAGSLEARRARPLAARRCRRGAGRARPPRRRPDRPGRGALSGRSPLPGWIQDLQMT